MHKIIILYAYLFICVYYLVICVLATLIISYEPSSAPEARLATLSDSDGRAVREEFPELRISLT